MSTWHERQERSSQTKQTNKNKNKKETEMHVSKDSFLYTGGVSVWAIHGNHAFTASFLTGLTREDIWFLWKTRNRNPKQQQNYSRWSHLANIFDSRCGSSILTYVTCQNKPPRKAVAPKIWHFLLKQVVVFRFFYFLFFCFVCIHSPHAPSLKHQKRPVWNVLGVFST